MKTELVLHCSEQSSPECQKRIGVDSVLMPVTTKATRTWLRSMHGWYMKHSIHEASCRPCYMRRFKSSTPEELRARKQLNAMVGIAGQGPDGETCGSCRHCKVTRKKTPASWKYTYKCALAKGPRKDRKPRDLRKIWPACERWKARP